MTYSAETSCITFTRRKMRDIPSCKAIPLVATTCLLLSSLFLRVSFLNTPGTIFVCSLLCDYKKISFLNCLFFVSFCLRFRDWLHWLQDNDCSVCFAWFRRTTLNSPDDLLCTLTDPLHKICCLKACTDDAILLALCNSACKGEKTASNRLMGFALFAL